MSGFEYDKHSLCVTAQHIPPHVKKLVILISERSKHKPRSEEPVLSLVGCWYLEVVYKR